MKLLIVLCLGTLALAAPAPQQRKTIDFLLEQNPDVLEPETPASVQPLPQPQIATTTGVPEQTKTSQDPAPVYEEQAEVREAPREVTPNASQLSAENESKDAEESEEDKLKSSESDEHEEEKQTEPSVAEEESPVQDTTIRVYDEEEENQEEETHSTEEPNHEQDDRIGDLQKHNEDSYQYDDEESKTQDPVEEKEPEQDHTTTLGPIELDNTNKVVGDEEHTVELDSHQLFNHGTLIVEKGTFDDEELKILSTTPASFKKWEHDHKFGPDGLPPKFGYFGHHHHHEHDHRFGGPPPAWVRGQHFGGPPPHSWHHHHHDHEHDHDHDLQHRHGPAGHDGFYSHGFHRTNGNWKWN